MPESPKLYLILSETWTMNDPRDLPALVQQAVTAERAGMHGVEIGEHIVMGPNSAINGVPENPRAWIGGGNQRSEFPHPIGLHILSAMSAVTTDLRLMAGALLTPFRHPLLLAKELATVDLLSRGRLIVIPGLSWQREEFAALDVPFTQRGEILDEQLAIWHDLWSNGSPIEHHGKHYDFSEVWVEPQPYRPGGPELWVGARAFAPWAVRRVVRYGSGFFPIVPPTEDEMAELADEMKRANREMASLELGAFLFGAPFTGTDDLLDLDETLAAVPGLVSKGFTNLVIKPSQHIDDPAQLGDFCRTLVRKVDDLVV